jgi:hypothetical protein
MYYHGESINVNVVVTNNSNKTLRKIRISGKSIKIEQNDYFVFDNKNRKTKISRSLITHI